MAYIDKNGIQFNSFDSNASAFKKKLSNTQYAGASVDDLADIANDNDGVLPTTINAIEIDWNAAQLGDTTITTSGDLLSYVTTISEEVNNKSKVSVSRTLTSGTQIASITVNGTKTQLYAPTPTTGTVNSVKINNNEITPDTNGVVDLGNVLTSIPSEYVTETELSGKGYITTSTADDKYQTKGDYLTAVPSEYVTETELSGKGYITTSTADDKYQVKGDYLTSIPDEYVTETELANALDNLNFLSKNSTVVKVLNINTTGNVSLSNTFKCINIAKSITYAQYSDLVNLTGSSINHPINIYVYPDSGYTLDTSKNISVLPNTITANWKSDNSINIIANSIGGVSLINNEMPILLDIPTTKDIISVTGVTVEPSTISIKNDSSTTLTATVTPTNATNKSVTWSSNNESVATVSTAGVVTGKSVGTATITATTQDGSYKDTCTVSVTSNVVNVTGIQLNSTSYTLIGNSATKTLTATVTPTNATNKSVTWSSNNDSVATVSTTGVVTSKGIGTATITATSKDGTNISASCKITVKEATVSNITISGTNNIKVGATTTLTAKVNSTNGTLFENGVTWSGSNTYYSINNTGVVTGISQGTGIVTATSKANTNIFANYNITVSKYFQQLVISDVNNLYAGDSVQLTVSGNNTDNTPVWKIADNSTYYATITSNGYLTTKNPGNVTVTVTVQGNNTYLTGASRKTITILEKPVETKYYWYVGQTNPASNSTITSTVGAEGWRLIDNLDNVSKANPLFDTTTTSDDRITGTKRDYWYVAVPTDKSYKIYDSDYVDQITAGNFEKQSSTISFNNVNYTVYKGVGTARNFDGYTIY